MAISLYFQDADPLGILTLAGAAHGLLCDLIRSGNATGRGQPKRVKYLIREIAAAKNFLKHAQKYPNAILPFNSNWPEFVIYDSIGMHVLLSIGCNRSNTFFLLWITAKYPFMSILDTYLDASHIAELRSCISALGGEDVKKRTFLRALNKAAQPRAGPL